jgi:hypothetical protein
MTLVEAQHAQIVEEYKRLRKKSIPLGTALVKTLTGEEIDRAARALGMIEGGKIVLETDDEIAVLMDYALYDLYRDGRNAMQRYLEGSPPAAGSDELRLLRSMVNAMYALLKVERVIPGMGVVVKDAAADNELILVDLGFSQSARVGKLIASRIYCLGEWWMTGGAALPVPSAAGSRMVERIPKLAISDADEQRRQQTAFSTFVIRECVAAGASQRIAYSNTAERHGAPALASVRVGQNDPCPCGSGKKYKKCCEK